VRQTECGAAGQPTGAYVPPLHRRPAMRPGGQTCCEPRGCPAPNSTDCGMC
jgi:hypothetical protein